MLKVNNFINKTHTFSSLFRGFLVGLKFSLAAASKTLFGKSHISNVSGVSWSLYFDFASILYFSYIILFVLSFSFWTTCSRLAETIFQLSMEILKTTMHFLRNKYKIKLLNIAIVQHNYLWMIKSKNCLKPIVNIKFKKRIAPISSLLLPLTKLVFIFVWTSEQHI